MAVLKLKDVADAFDSASSDWQQFINAETGEIVFLPEDPMFTDCDMDEDEMEELIDEIEDPDGPYYRIPDQYEINEYAIMRDFAAECGDERIRTDLENVLHRPHSYRKFKDSINYFGIVQNYYDFRYAAYLDKAREWCRSNGLEYEDYSVTE